MEIFEVHITGNELILGCSDLLSVKSIAIDLLKPDWSYMRTEHMTSQVVKCSNYLQCKNYVDDLVDKLSNMGVEIKRVKIESPCYSHYIDNSLYIESHFMAIDNSFPMSRNVRKTELTATDRQYDRHKYDAFCELHDKKEIELCLFDSDPKEDLDWLMLYNRN